MNILERIQEIIATESNDSQLDKFLSEVRDSLAISSKQFITYSILIVTALVTYHLIVYEGASGISFNSIQISNTSLFRRVFLVFPAALMAAMASIGYLRRIQREVYDYLTISRYRVLGKTGLHELRIPADYILGLFMLSNEGGLLGKIVSYAVTFLSVFVFIIGPAFYVISESATNIRIFGTSDFLCLLASAIAVALSVCSLVIIALSGRIKA
jgi:hypothetical protein